MSDSRWADLEEAADSLRGLPRPRLAMVLGSGLGGLAGEVTDSVRVSYADIPHFPVSTAPGHSGTLVAGSLMGLPVLTFSGRSHLYEGYSPDQVVFGVRLARVLGAESLLITNAAGSVNPEYEPGTLMLISDHINLTGRNPLIGPADVRLGTRFPDMSTAYDPVLRTLARDVARSLGIDLAEGVYLGLTGPSYETPAEIRMARTLGAAAVGMSTVLEVIAARHMGLRVLGISCLTNMAAGILPQPLTEEEVIETAGRVRETFAALVRGFAADYSGSTV